ncbi:MAG: hypothetical protein RI973_95 [Bacteroidota bacterium]|jgi:hypothetical protein
MSEYQLNNERIMYAKVGEHGVIYILEKNAYHTANETMSSILSLIRDGKTEDEILSALLDEYDVPEDECRSDLKETLEKLLTLGYIKKR